MLTIGLTGGIGSGKSTVTKIFSELGVSCLDADDVAKQLTQPGEIALSAIRDQFGNDILNKDGSLNREKLRQQIFSDDAKRLQIESILHPLIFETIRDWRSQQNAPYIVISIPLLAGSRHDYQLDRVIAIDIDLEEQRQRAAQRDNAKLEAIDTIIAAQASANERRAIADDIINNNGDLDALRAQVFNLHQQYIAASNIN